MNEVSLFRLYLLRAMYLLVSIGLGLVVWPQILFQSKPWELKEGVVFRMLGAFHLMAVLGLRYPLQMLPALLWELSWKVIWLGVVALPQWSAGTIDTSTRATAGDCLWVVILPFVIPWGYVYQHYLKKPGDRWRSAKVHAAVEPAA
ncbi:MAG: hypothetical protein JWR56_2569 [Massilia sp.]|nr:hypothetical protein [Massilia sp.]